MRKRQANEAWQLASRSTEERIAEEDDHGVWISRNKSNAAVRKALLHGLSSNSAWDDLSTNRINTVQRTVDMYGVDLSISQTDDSMNHAPKERADECFG